MRIFLFALCFFISASAQAEWTRLGDTPEASYSIDPRDVRIDGDVRSVPVLYDIKAPRAGAPASRITLNHYDCKRLRFRMLSWSAHSLPTARGKVLDTGNGSPDWKPVEGDAVAATVLKRVCAIK